MPFVGQAMGPEPQDKSTGLSLLLFLLDRDLGCTRVHLEVQGRIWRVAADFPVAHRGSETRLARNRAPTTLRSLSSRLINAPLIVGYAGRIIGASGQ